MAGTNSTTIELLKKYNFSIQKKYGQNFLIDDNILSGIVSAAEVTKDDIVLEIGPGLGALTGQLCRAAGQVIAVEVDKMLIPILGETMQDYDNFTLVNEDILKVDIEELIADVVRNKMTQTDAEKPEENIDLDSAKDTDKSVSEIPKIKVVANLPYYITTPIIMELLEKKSCIKSITVMVQKEVAERMQEEPGSKSYGALSLAVQYYSKPEYVMTVTRNCFLPRPDVDSAVIRLDIYEPDKRPVKAADPSKLFAIIRAAFNQRRKTLANSIANAQALSYTREQVADALREMNLSETVRGEALTLEEFARLSDLLG